MSGLKWSDLVEKLRQQLRAVYNAPYYASAASNARLSSDTWTAWIFREFDKEHAALQRRLEECRQAFVLHLLELHAPELLGQVQSGVKTLDDALATIQTAAEHGGEA